MPCWRHIKKMVSVFFYFQPTLNTLLDGGGGQIAPLPEKNKKTPPYSY